MLATRIEKEGSRVLDFLQRQWAGDEGGTEGWGYPRSRFGLVCPECPAALNSAVLRATGPAKAGTRAPVSASNQQGESPCRGCLEPRTDGNCVAVRRGGEQPEVND